MGQSLNDTIVYAIALFCKVIIILGSFFGFLMCVFPKEDSDYTTFFTCVFVAVFVCSIFVWVARDPTLDD